MKIVYSIITLIDEDVWELLFWLVLNKKEWILINQFRNRPVKVSLAENIRPFVFGEIREPLVFITSEQDDTFGNLVLPFDPSTIEQ